MAIKGHFMYVFCRGGFILFYPLVLYALLSVIPIAFINYFPIKSNGTVIRRTLLSCISLVMFVLITHYITDPFYYHYWYAMIPLFVTGLYAGKFFLTMTSIASIVIYAFKFSTTSELLHFMTCIVIILIVNLLIYAKYHELSSDGKLFLALGGILLAGALNFLITIQGSIPSRIMKPDFILWEQIVYGFLFISTVLFVFSVLIKQSEHEEKINALQNLEENYQNELNMWSQLVRLAPFAVLNIGIKEEITYGNERAFAKYPALQKVKNGPANQIQKLEHILDSETYQEISIIVKEVYKKKTSASTKVLYEDCCYLFTAFPILSHVDQSIISVSLYVQDITELQHLRNEMDHMDRLNLVGQMAASITHEIRNPMAVIRGFVQLLQEKSSSIQREYYRIIIEEIDRANAMITDFLALAKQKDSTKEFLQLNKVIDDISPLLIADANFRGQTIEFYLDEQLPPLSINEREIKQLLLNIARNAMEATEERGIVQIRTSSLSDGILLSISDDGQGIPDELKRKIFEPFYTLKSNGTGLGLPLCADIVKRHNAQIEVLNNENKGSIFNIFFPLEQQFITS